MMIRSMLYDDTVNLCLICACAGTLVCFPAINWDRILSACLVLCTVDKRTALFAVKSALLLELKHASTFLSFGALGFECMC